MRLTLENFRCYKAQTFEIPENGISLISGDSGKGKTTIFKAINFVLYDDEKKVASFGSRKCKAELQFTFQNFEITAVRTKTPNHLTLSVIINQEGEETELKLQDDPAQAWINQHLGCHFLQTCYMSQKCLNNFFTQPREVRAELLRSLCVQSIDIDNIKSTIKDHIKNRKTSLYSATSEYNFVKSEMVHRGFQSETLQEPLCPHGCHPNNVEQTKLEVLDLHKDNWSKLQVAQRQVVRLNESLQECLKRASSVATYQVQLQDAKIKLKEADLRCAEKIQSNESIVQEVREQLVQLELQQKLQSKQSELLVLQQELEAKRVQELSTITSEIEHNSFDVRQLKDAEDELVYMQTCVKAFEEIKVAWKKLNDSLKAQVVLDASSLKFCCEEAKQLSYWNLVEPDIHSTQLQESLNQQNKLLADLKKQLNTTFHKCPSCQITLAYINNAIILHDKIRLQDEVKSLEKEIALSSSVLKEQLLAESRFKAALKNHHELVFIIDQYSDYLEENVPELANDISKNKEEIKWLKNQEMELKSLQQKKQDLLNPKPHNVVLFLKKEIQQIQLKLSSTNRMVDVEESGDLDQLHQDLQQQLSLEEDKLTDYKVQLGIQKEWNTKRVQLQDTIVRLERLIDQCTKDDVELLQREIFKLNEEIQVRSEKSTSLEHRKNVLVNWQLENNQYIEYRRLYDKMQMVEEEVSKHERAYKTSLNLLSLVQESESLAMQVFLQQLNEECEKHLEIMFGPEMTLKVIYGDQSKDKETPKYFVDVMLFRNGEEIDYSSLSGGECDRCALALFLSFNKIAKSPMLLLDECLSSLHAESVEAIVDHIKQEFREKICIMTLHQTTKGIFDQIVEL